MSNKLPFVLTVLLGAQLRADPSPKNYDLGNLLLAGVILATIRAGWSN